MKKNWGEERVMFTGPDGKMQSMPLSWTSMAPEDPFVVVARGRSLFRLNDLAALALLVRGLEESDRGNV